MMRDVRVSKFEKLEKEEKFIVAPTEEDEVNSENPFFIFTKIKRSLAKGGMHNAVRLKDGLLSHMPPDMNVVRLEDVPNGIPMA